MSRLSRVVVPGLPHHITARGNGRQATFRSDPDRSVYLDMLRQNRRQFGLSIRAYCLMPNHIHLLAVPERADSMARTLGRTHADCARYWNARRGSCGHVWQARYYSCPIEDGHVWVVAQYVEKNPVRAGLVDDADSWPWSSALAHLTGRDRSGLLDMATWTADYDSIRWRRVLETSVDDEAWHLRLKEATLTGRPFGSDGFVGKLEGALGCRLRPRSAGRPRKLCLTA
jgi:putative transposase